MLLISSEMRQKSFLKPVTRFFRIPCILIRGFIDLLFALLFLSIVRNTLIMAEIPSISFISQDMKEDYGKSSTQKNWKRKQRQKENGTRACENDFRLIAEIVSRHNLQVEWLGGVYSDIWNIYSNDIHRSLIAQIHCM